MHIPDLEKQADDDLVRAFVDTDDRDALEVLLRRHESTVYGLAFRVLGNRADAYDATQETMLNVFRKAKTFKHQSAFTTWLYRMTTNACYDLSRKRTRQPVPTEDLPSRDTRSDMGEEVAGRMDIETALSSLTVEHRLAIVMRDIQGLSYEQIAEITRTPIGTVKSRIARARLAMGTALGEPAPNKEPKP